MSRRSMADPDPEPAAAAAAAVGATTQNDASESKPPETASVVDGDVGVERVQTQKPSARSSAHADAGSAASTSTPASVASHAPPRKSCYFFFFVLYFFLFFTVSLYSFSSVSSHCHGLSLTLALSHTFAFGI